MGIEENKRNVESEDRRRWRSTFFSRLVHFQMPERFYDNQINDFAFFSVRGRKLKPKQKLKGDQLSTKTVPINALNLSLAPRKQ